MGTFIVLVILPTLGLVSVTFAQETGKACSAHERGRCCFDGVDNDSDGQSDCEDPDCLRDPRVQQKCRKMDHHKGVKHELGKRACFDGKDNDGDGQKDCEDPDCQANPAIAAHCKKLAGIARSGEMPKGCVRWFDGCNVCHRQNMNSPMRCTTRKCFRNGYASCRSYDRAYKERQKCFNGRSYVRNGENCCNGEDDDGDSKADCDDEDCKKLVFQGLNYCTNPNRYSKWDHKETGKECFDDRDNDGDGKHDCDDPDCQAIPAIATRCKLLAGHVPPGVCDCSCYQKTQEACVCGLDGSHTPLGGTCSPNKCFAGHGVCSMNCCDDVPLGPCCGTSGTSSGSGGH